MRLFQLIYVIIVLVVASILKQRWIFLVWSIEWISIRNAINFSVARYSLGQIWPDVLSVFATNISVKNVKIHPTYSRVNVTEVIEK